MSKTHTHTANSTHWPAVATAGLRVAFGIVWAVGAALVWSPDFAAHYVGYLHNAAQGQPAWSAWWFSMWIALVTPHAGLFIWATRIIETVIAFSLIFGLGRRTLYVAGALFSLLVWSTAEGFGGPYSVGATNMGTAVTYVLIFVALIGLDYRAGFIPYSLDYWIERRWPCWRRLSQWSGDKSPAKALGALPWRVQLPTIAGVAILLVLLLIGLQSSLNVKSASPTTAAAAVSPLALASSEVISHTRDPRLPPLVGTGDSVDVHLVATDKTVAIASGVRYRAWTFGDSVPGPIVHVREGQTVNMTFTNEGTMLHSIDFHAAFTPPSESYVDIKPGESITFSFVADTPGAFLYHCGTYPTLLHIGNGMYGALIVSPKEGLPEAQRNYVLVQSEWYTRQIAGTLMGPDFAKMKAVEPDEVVFNGAAFQYANHPLPVTVGERVRVWFVNAGPNVWSSFHVIGAIFNKIYPDGDPAHALSGVSTYGVGPGEGAVFDLVFKKAGDYPFVDHVMAHAIIGAKGVFAVRARGDKHPPAVVKKPAADEGAENPDVVQQGASTAAASGPYEFDAQHGAQLYSTHCAMCHKPGGTGMANVFPPLKGNPSVLNADATEHIDTVLHGASGREIDGVTYHSIMPPFASQLNDAEVADVVNHERTSWGNNGKIVTVEDVAKVRAAGK